MLGPSSIRITVNTKSRDTGSSSTFRRAYLKIHDNLDETNVAKLARGMIKEHLTLLTGVQKVGWSGRRRPCVWPVVEPEVSPNPYRLFGTRRVGPC